MLHFSLDSHVNLNEMFFVRFGINGFHLDTLYDDHGSLLYPHDDYIEDISADRNHSTSRHNLFDTHLCACFFNSAGVCQKVLFWGEHGNDEESVYLRESHLDYPSAFSIRLNNDDKIFPGHYVDCFGLNLSKIDPDVTLIQMFVYIYDEQCSTKSSSSTPSFAVSQRYGIPRRGSIRLLQDKKQLIIHQLDPSKPEIRNMHLLDIMRLDKGWSLCVRMKELLPQELKSYMKAIGFIT